MNATTQLETVNVKAEKRHGLGNQQPSAVAHEHGEGSTTREQSLRVQVDPKCLGPESVCKTCGQARPAFEFYLHKSTGKPRAHCKPCLYANQRDYAARNPNVMKAVAMAAARRYRVKHPEKVSAGFAAWRESRKGELNERAAQWRDANRGTVNHYKAKRRALSRLATPAWADLDKIKAIYAEAKASGRVVDHDVPLRGKSVCGLHVEHNLRLLTRQENARKYNKHDLGQEIVWSHAKA